MGIFEIFWESSRLGFLGDTGGTDWRWIGRELLAYGSRVVGTCAVFYGLFWLRILGAGDVKLMAVIVGNLGTEGGCTVIFCGFLMVFALELWKEMQNVSFYWMSWRERWECLCGRRIRLAPYFLAGYLIWLGCVVWM